MICTDCFCVIYSENLLKVAVNFPRENIVSLGTCFGKFTKTRKFRLQITALEYMAPYAKVGTLTGALWLVPLSPNHFYSLLCSIKSGWNLVLSSSSYMAITWWKTAWDASQRARHSIKEWLYIPWMTFHWWVNIAFKLGTLLHVMWIEYTVVLKSKMALLQQGFGVAAKSATDCRHTDPMTIVCFHQADIGEYIRNEDTLTWKNSCGVLKFIILTVFINPLK